MEKIFKVEPEDNKKRLDKFLAENLSELSRSRIQKLIENELVFVSGKNKNKKYVLKEGEKVRVIFKEEKEISLEPDKSVDFEIIFENDDLAVINKPAGLVVHPSNTQKEKTLVNGLLAKWPEIKNVGEDLLRPGIVHRLDKETSGLMLVAKTQESFLFLKEEFKERRVKKVYQALVFGEIEERRGEIIAEIGRVGEKQTTILSGRGRKKIKNKKEAKTKYEVERDFDGFTLVRAMPETGRMHQIRVHFLHIGYPIVGDKKYTPKKTFEKLPFERHFLHAQKLSFMLPGGEKKEFKTDMPKDLKNLLKSLNPR